MVVKKFIKQTQNPHKLRRAINLKNFLAYSPFFYFFVKHKQKKYLLINDTPTNTFKYADSYFINLIVIKFFSKNKNKNNKNNSSVVSNFFKNFLKLFLELLSYKKMYKFNKKINKFVFKPKFNLIKNKQTPNKFFQIKNNLKVINNKKKIKTQHKLFIFFVLNYNLMQHTNKFYQLKKINKISIFINIVYYVLKSINYYIFKK